MFEIETDSSKRTRQALGKTAGIEKIETTGDESVRVYLPNDADSDAMSGKLLSALLTARIPVRSFVHAVPSLEDVYLSLTGENRQWH